VNVDEVRREEKDSALKSSTALAKEKSKKGELSVRERHRQSPQKTKRTVMSILRIWVRATMKKLIEKIQQLYHTGGLSRVN